MLCLQDYLLVNSRLARVSDNSVGVAGHRITRDTPYVGAAKEGTFFFIVV